VSDERNELDPPAGCGSHSCYIEAPHGQGTNGPCKCFDGIQPRAKAVQVRACYAKMKARLRELEAEVERLKDCELIAWGLSIGTYIRDLGEHPTAWIVAVREDGVANYKVFWRVVQRGFPGLPKRVYLNEYHEHIALTPEARRILTTAKEAAK
jgi:hypothetical protein